MKWGSMAAATALAVLLLTGTAMADYQSDQDVTVSVQLLPGTVQTTDTGSTTFALQESVHDTLTATTGTSVNHYYTWVYVNGQPVLAVDPLCVYTGR
jgi:UDP-N-acetylmuramyl tripeptide synthase